MRGGFLKVLSYVVGPADNNLYAIIDDAESECVLVDPGIDSQWVWLQIKTQPYRFPFILNTHAHLDHIYENAFFRMNSGGKLCMHADAAKSLDDIPLQASWFGMDPPDPFEPDGILTDNEEIPVGAERLKVIHTPGHSPGGVCFVGNDFVISGDILFAGSVGRTDLPGGDRNALLCSIRTKLLSLPDTYTVYPGHGPTTTIGNERLFNPFLKEIR
jgi:hydroxyacylglutathione hydrolase